MKTLAIAVLTLATALAQTRARRERNLWNMAFGRSPALLRRDTRCLDDR
jgi:hypothetical protein